MITIMFLLFMGILLLCLIPIFGGILAVFLPIVLIVVVLIGLDVIFIKSLFGKKKKDKK